MPDNELIAEKHDSSLDTLLHIKRVSELMTQACTELINRANKHDDSKLKSPEKEWFDELTPKLKGLVYDSPEYHQSRKDLKVALEHHYAHNSHHPEHYADGIDGMNLFDVVEMFFDWKAASERHNDGNINKSIDLNRVRFRMSDQLTNIFKNTVKCLRW
jgi:hypothetical protein